MKVVSEGEAIRNILGSPKRYVFYLGAGASAEAGIATAEAICQTIRADLLAHVQGVDSTDRDAVARWADENLDWGDTSRRYVTCVRRGYPNEARRLGYFRDMLRRAQPSFGHHALALLVSRGYVAPTCVTTNFDHLLESAFMRQGLEFQAIRSEEELQYWQNVDDRLHVLKLHGDIDTLNILNTSEETIAIGDRFHRKMKEITRGAGLVVLGTGANEKSVRKLFEDLSRSASGVNDVLSYGLLWGVYMGEPRPKSLVDGELERRVQERVDATDIHRDIVEVLDYSRNELFSFFPVWGTGEFMLALVRATADKQLIGAAALRLDHEMRLRQVFGNAGLAPEAVDRHLSSLARQREKLAKKSEPRRDVDQIVVATANSGELELRVLYGDITSRSLMGTAEFQSVRRAVVSPEDTLVSAGGGVAYQLLEKAGPELILNELAKFAPIAHRSVAVTSAGALPVHYMFHAAALEITPDATYDVSKDDVSATMVEILEKASALGVGVVWVPLLAAGVAALEPLESFEGLLQAMHHWYGSASTGRLNRLTVAIVIYQEGQLSRSDVLHCVDQILGSDFTAHHADAADMAHQAADRSP